MVKLILIRHGQSIWNLENKFTGWVDVSLSSKGSKEAKKAGKLLKDFKFDIAFTSKLIRAQKTLFEILDSNNFCDGYICEHEKVNNNWYSHFSSDKLNSNFITVKISEALNERFYGDLQGLNKDETRKKYGEEQVHIWRRSFDIRPPNGECLKDTSKRTIPYLKKEILSQLKKGKNVLVSAHGNSLRAIIMHLENLSGDEIMEVELGTGIPIIYEFDEKLNLIKKSIL